MYAKWVHSWRDLPILINQWCNVMRWEKRPRLFLRTSEFLWQEGHTAHASREEAMEETLRMLEVYRSIMADRLALPVVPGEKSEGERFPGADNTYTCETMMSDKRALQAGTSHFLGQNFAKAFDIKFQSKSGEIEHAWTTSWGVSTRLIGALIMTHSDNDGLILPPEVAPVRTVLFPISTDEARLRDVLLPQAREIVSGLEKVLGTRRALVDEQFHLRPGDRFFSHLQKGVPLRLELGEREVAGGTVRAVRRDTGEKIDLPRDTLPQRVPELLASIQADLLEKARSFREANTCDAASFDEMKEILSGKGGFVRAFFGGSREEERAIKEATQATIRCYPLEDDARGTCFYTGKKDVKRCLFAKAY
jgi:prolyl-tRNA synthetase